MHGLCTLSFLYAHIEWDSFSVQGSDIFIQHEELEIPNGQMLAVISWTVQIITVINEKTLKS